MTPSHADHICALDHQNRTGCSMRYASPLIASAVLVLAACASGTGDGDEAARPGVVATAPVTENETTSPDLPQSPQPTTVPAVSAPAPDEAEKDPASSRDAVPAYPDAVVATVAGGQIDFGSLEGQDTVLWFWAPW